MSRGISVGGRSAKRAVASQLLLSGAKIIWNMENKFVSKL